MIIEAMFVSGVGFSAWCAWTASGHPDKIAEDAGWQEKGELERWQKQNEFDVKCLLDLDDFVEDVKEEMGIKDEPKESEEKTE
mmetsp:Transcript_21528/g.33682  ORF Transcript_21528/g.33682 Transcript_21528/m.33682 type:complete len:83 (+) Transcript_21528:333-581(+)|eukprot:CAMPEP_0184297406 /NCGR_PEP_ID=MMETSP1049-20130417/8324_1 /TAXON_ID=77928 /ORGANISM="Proteomonas sulcata, Strain CCMP704" /LENGTH=82 /DNA_ID=CAMNT_0026607129 /DNA_START=246 /DNA_END=494 /DNA_ORIENTATION=+